MGKAFSVIGFESKALTTDYYNLSPGSPWGGYSQNAVTENGISETLGQTLGFGGYAVTINGSLGNQTAVLLGPNFFSDRGIPAIDNLLHEDLHAYTDWSDQTIFQKFSSYSWCTGVGEPIPRALASGSQQTVRPRRGNR